VDARFQSYFDTNIFAKLENFKFRDVSTTFFSYSWAKPETMFGCTGLVIYFSEYAYSATHSTKEMLSYTTPISDIPPASYNLLLQANETSLITWLVGKLNETDAKG